MTFLGTPHIASCESECRDHLAVLFRPVLKTVTNKTITQQNLADLYISAKKFATKFAEPCCRGTILSGYETVEIKLLSKKPWRKTEQALVSNQLTISGSRSSILIACGQKLR